MPITQIFFRQLRVESRVGILEHELQKPQQICIDAELSLHIEESRLCDEDIGSVLDYRSIRLAIIDECRQGHCNLVEVLASRIASRLLQSFPAIERAKIKVDKPQAFEDCATVGIECTQYRNPHELSTS